MNDCWDCIHLEKRTGGFQYCLLYGGRRNVDANKSRCDDWTPDEPAQLESDIIFENTYVSISTQLIYEELK